MAKAATKTSTSTALTTPLTQEELDNLARMTGQAQDRGEQFIVSMPRIKINADISYPKNLGQYMVPLPKDHELYEEDSKENFFFANEVSTIILVKAVQYQRYDDADKKYYSTTLERQTNSEFPDVLGTKKLGKITGKAALELSEEAKKVNSAKGKYTLRVFVLATAEGVTPKGKKVSVENMPAQIMIQSSVIDYLKNFFQNKEIFGDKENKYWEFETRLPADVPMKKQGSTSWYPFVFELGAKLPVTREIVESIYGVDAEIKRFNDYVMSQHRAVVNGSNKDSKVASAISGTADLDDEIPF